MAFNDPTLSDSQAEANVDAVVESLLSVLVTLVIYSPYPASASPFSLLCSPFFSPTKKKKISLSFSPFSLNSFPAFF